MFERITLHGEQASLVWAYHTAATLRSWKVHRGQNSPDWKLTATVTSADLFQTRQRPLLFTAPREKGRFCWEVRELHISDRQLTATLGQPVQ
jgi:hypothetical protein